MRLSIPGLDESDGEVFSKISAGKYPLQIKGVDVDKVAKNTAKYPGNPLITIKCAIPTGEEHEGHSITFSLMYPDETLPEDIRNQCIGRIKRFLIAVGLDSEEDGFDSDELLGLTFLADISVNGKYNQVDDYLPIS